MKRRALSIILIIFGLLSCSSRSSAQGPGSGWSNPIDLTGGVTQNWRAYPTMACDLYQNMHFFWADQSDDGAAIYYRNDISGTLSYPNDVILLNEHRVFYLKSAISPTTDTIHLNWVSDFINSAMYYSNAHISEAGSAKSWLPPTQIGTFVSNTDIAVSSDGNVHIVYSVSEQEGTENNVFHIVSTDDGDSWSDPELIYSRTSPQPASIQVWLEIDAKDRFHLGLTLRSWEYGVFSEVGYLRSSEGGTPWLDYHMIDNIGTAWQGVAWIEPYAFGDDEIHLTWHDPRRMHQWSSDGGLTWSQPEEIMPMGAAFGGPNQLVKDSAGTVHVVTAILTGVYTATWSDQRWSSPEEIDSRDIDAHSQYLTACQGNQLHVVFWDRIGDETVWYLTKRLNAPNIARQPVPVLSREREEDPLPVNPGPSTVIPTATENPLRETLAADPIAPMEDTNFKLSTIFFGIIPSILVTIGVFLFAIIKLRR